MKITPFLPLLLTGAAIANPLVKRQEDNPNDLTVLDSLTSEDTAVLVFEGEPEPEVNFSEPTNTTIEERAALIPRAAATSIQWSHNWNGFSKPFHGDHLIVLRKNGEVRFKTYFKNTSKLQNFHYGIACAVRDAAGRGYSLSRKGKVHGKWRQGSQSHSVDKTNTVTAIKNNWADLVRKHDIRCEVQVRNALSLQALLDLVKKVVDVLRIIGPIIGTVIALF